MHCHSSLPQAEDVCGRGCAGGLEFVTERGVTFPNTGDEHRAVVVERQDRVKHDSNVTEFGDFLKCVVGVGGEMCEDTPGEVRSGEA